MSADTEPTKGPLRVFMSYRREDSPGHAGRLYDTLSVRLPQAELFMDVDNIEPGVDFIETINAAVGSCDVLLALIGPRWGSVSRKGSRRLEAPGDFVRLELEAALHRDIRVIPVLLRDASMPRAEDLPESLQELTHRNAIRIADDRWRTDADRLVSALAKIVPRELAKIVPRELEKIVPREPGRPPLRADHLRIVGLVIMGFSLITIGFAFGSLVILPLLQ